jgi:hypothetical protein
MDARTNLPQEEPPSRSEGFQQRRHDEIEILRVDVWQEMRDACLRSFDANGVSFGRRR